MISVVIPLYNKEQSIVSTLQSVLAQTYTDYELIVVDDGSTDNSLNVVHSFVNSFTHLSVIKIVHKDNGGVCSARNRGIRESRGEYIAFLDADDIWDKDYLMEQRRMISDFPEAALWAINYAEIYNGMITHHIPTGLPNDFRGYVENYFTNRDRVSDLCCSSSVVLRRDVFDKVGYFDERIRYAEDTDMWWRIIALYPFAFYDRYMVFYQMDAENRALKRRRRLKYFLPYYVSKFQQPLFQSNAVFYRYINRWAVCHIRNYYFSQNPQDRQEAKEATKTLDYTIIPFKYRLLYKSPYPLAKFLNILDKLYHQ